MSPKHSVSFAPLSNNTRAQSVETPERQPISPKKGRSASAAANYFRPQYSLIRFGQMRFLITDRPDVGNLENYYADLVRFRVSALVRVCESTYNVEALRNKGLRVEDWAFIDGQPPPEEIIDKWVRLCADLFAAGEQCIAVHCVAGLGRAPVLVGIALLEAGMNCEDAVMLIRSQRRGALNETQLAFLQQFKSQGRLRRLRYDSPSKQRKSCAIM